MSARPSLERLVPASLAATVFAFACGSSSVAAANHVGKTLRWAMLLLLLGVAGAWARDALRARARSTPTLLAAAAFCALALDSAGWSIDPRLSVGRAGSLVLLFATAALLALGSAGSGERVRRVLAGLVLGAAAVALAGLVVLLAAHGTAVVAATYDLAARYQGFGENPDTASLLLALALAPTLWFALAGSTRAVRTGALALALGFDASIVASGSRGSLVAGAVGSAAVAALTPRTRRGRAIAVAAVAVLVVASVAALRIPKPAGRAASPPPPASTAAPARTRYIDAEKALPLSFDIGTTIAHGAPTSARGFLGSSGRALAWRGAIDTGNRRPLLGYGFGTEAKAFVDRYALFQGDLPENSYIGIYLQLGAIGLAAFAALVLAVLVATARSLQRPAAAPCLAVVLAGLALAVVQSYVYSVGNIGTATLWICAFLGALALRRPEEGEPAP